MTFNEFLEGIDKVCANNNCDSCNLNEFISGRDEHSYSYICIARKIKNIVEEVKNAEREEFYKEKGIQKTCETCKHLRCFNEGYYCNHNLPCIRGNIYPEKPKFTNCEFWEWESLSSQGSERNDTNTNRTSDM